jgi:phosphatidylserine/phosphatidylglycerophosphate/cardiolipin synthase-like enzyme
VISISSQRQLFSAMERARSVLLTAYTLRSGPVLGELEDAARRGACVTVRLEGRPRPGASGEIAAANRFAIKALRRAGADAKLVDTNARNGPPMHMKAAVCDGVAYLDDRNFPVRNDSIVRDDFAADVGAIESAVFSGRDARAPQFWTNKRDALWAERRLLAGAATAKRVDVESESFGFGGGAYSELKMLAQAGVQCRLLVSRREVNDKTQRALATLQSAGVEVRVGDSNEKMAIVDGSRAWIGSANSTSGFYNDDAIEWGLRTAEPAVVTHLSGSFESAWKAATPF